MRSRRPNAGFTFIELIIAITIFSIIAVSVYSVFRAGMKLWMKTNPLIQANQADRFFFDTISKDLKNAIMYYDSTNKDNVNFAGEPKKMSFMTLMEVSAKEGAIVYLELAKVTYYFDAATKTVKRTVATKVEGFDEAYAKGTDILTNCDREKIGFQYCYKDSFGASEETYSYDWEDTWSEELKLKIPRGVKVKVGSYTKTIFIPTADKPEVKK